MGMGVWLEWLLYGVSFFALWRSAFALVVGFVVVVSYFLCGSSIFYGFIRFFFIVIMRANLFKIPFFSKSFNLMG